MTPQPAEAGRPLRVWVLYHWLGHYRTAVCEELISNSKNRYEFWGSTTSFGEGIKVITELPDGRFRPTPTYRARGLNLQPSAVWHAAFGRYDALVAHAGVAWPTMWAAAAIARLRRKQVWYWTHGWTRRDNPSRGRIKKLYYGLAHGMMLYGHYAKVIGIEAGHDPAKLHVIYNSLDAQRQLALGAEITEDQRRAALAELFGEHAGRPTVICVARLNPGRRIDLLIDACRRLQASGQPVNLLVVGGGDIQPELEQLAIDSGVNAAFTGAVYDERRLATLIGAASVSVLPGPIGLFVMHSMAYGTPVISNDRFEGQMPEFEAIVPGLNGDFFREGDAADLAERMRPWLADEDRRRRGREWSREHIRRFYHPRTQRLIIDRALAGEPADDLLMPRLDRQGALAPGGPG